MSHHFECPNCGIKLRVSTQHIGKKLRCNGCQKIIRIAAGEKSSKFSIQAVKSQEQPNVLHCECGKRLKVKPKWTGKRIRCPNCNRVQIIPELEKSNAASILNPIGQNVNPMKMNLDCDDGETVVFISCECGNELHAKFKNQDKNKKIQCPKCNRLHSDLVDFDENYNDDDLDWEYASSPKSMKNNKNRHSIPAQIGMPKGIFAIISGPLLIILGVLITLNSKNNIYYGLVFVGSQFSLLGWWCFFRKESFWGVSHFVWFATTIIALIPTLVFFAIAWEK